MNVAATKHQSETPSHDSSAGIEPLMLELGRRAKAAARVLALADPAAKKIALMAAARLLRERVTAILKANESDLTDAAKADIQPALLDRLALDPKRMEAMAAGVELVAALPDPVGEVTETWIRPNGLMIERVRTPLGVIGVIYESRPNVTADAAALCIKAGNAVILRGGSDGFRSSQAIHAAMQAGLKEAGLPEDAISLVPTRDRDAVGLMLSGLNGAIDVIVPRGGKGLVERVQKDARVPVFAHLEGVCHVYVHEQADLEMAKQILLNAKMRRTGVCGAAETLLIDRAVAGSHAQPLVAMLLDASCEVRGDPLIQAVDQRVKPATDADWSTEYLDAIIAVKIVESENEAIDHIERYGSHHTDAIITADPIAAERFLTEVDSAIVLHNASTQFADGGEFGFGAEIGIATGRLHARGPVGAEQLTSFKYRVRGSGQIRP